MPDEQPVRLLNRLSPAEERGRGKGGGRLIEASRIAERSQRTGRTYPAAEPVDRKERAARNEKIRQAEENALISWAVQNECWQSSIEFDSTYGNRIIGEGAEAVVYLYPEEV